VTSKALDDSLQPLSKKAAMFVNQQLAYDIRAFERQSPNDGRNCASAKIPKKLPGFQRNPVFNSR
jgi:hypothetical protein